jgi:Transglycosylase SLT domain
MGDSPVFNAIKSVAGYGVGTLAALQTIKGGGLGSYLMNRQRLMSDPGFRASLAGSPFMSGVFGVSGHTGPEPAAPGLPATAGTALVAQPGPYASGYMFPSTDGQQVAPPGQAGPGQLPTPTALNMPGYEPGTPRRWQPNLPPYDPEQALKQQGLATAALGVQSEDVGLRAQSKMAAGIPLTRDEVAAATLTARGVQALGGQGTVVQLDIPGMKTNVGSPYNFTATGADEYPTAQLAQAAAAARNASIPPGNPQWTVMPTGRGTYMLSPPATAAQVAPLPPPATPPNVQGGTPATPPRVATPATPPQTPPVTPPPAAPPTQPGPYAGGYVLPATPPSQPPAPAAAPPAPPPQPPAPPPSSAFDRDAIVPHTVAPEPSGGTGYPSPAFDDQGVGSPSGAFIDQGGVVSPAPPPPTPRPPASPIVAPSGHIDLHAPWLRQLEVERGLPAGVLSGFAEKESGGNARIVARDPNSSAAGLFQITAGTARDWGMSPADRFDPVKAATATADVLAQRARSVGIERAVGMHYGGPGTPFNQVVGSSGLSPAGYSSDVLARAQKYAPAAGEVGYPSGSFDAEAAQLTVPVVPKPPVVAPPMPPAEAPPAPAAHGPTVLTGPPGYPPEQQMPMTGETRKTAEGEQTFHAPETSNADSRAVLTYNGVTNLETASPEKIRGIWNTQRYLDRQRKMDDAEIARTQKAVLEGDGAGLLSLMHARDGINRLVTDFPDPNVRAYYVGTLRYPIDTLKQMFSNDPQLAKFHTDVAALGVPLEGGSMIGRMLGLPGGSALLPGEQGALKSVLPSGATEPATFEENLQTYRDTVDSSIAMRDFLRGRPVGSTSVADVNNFLTNWNDARAQRRLDALRAAPPAEAPDARRVPMSPAPPPAPATPPPPSATPWAPLATWTVQ